MARPNKIGLGYFPMDVDLFQDIRIRKLIKYQSGKAITVYALLLCLIYQRGYYMRWDEELPFIISEQTGFEEAYILEVIKSCMALGLFSKKLYDEEQVITSKGIQERYLYICKLLKRRVGITEYSLIDEEKELVTSEETEVISEETSLDSVKMPQRKRKEKEIKEISLSRDKEKFPPPEVLDKTLSECYDELSCDRSWIEVVTMNTRNSGHKDFTIDMFGMYLKRFFDKLQNEGEVRKSPKDAKSHFARWLNKELQRNLIMNQNQLLATSTSKSELILSGESLDSWLSSQKRTQDSLQSKKLNEKKLALLEKYPTPSQMAVDYNPDLQGKLAKSNLTLADIALNDNIPLLANIRSVYGEDNAVRWLKVQFDSLNDYAEQGKGIDDSQLDELCSLVLGEYYWMNLAEICNFISRFKLGKYGQFYGAIGPMKITCYLLEYIKERRIDIERYEREPYRTQRQKEMEEHGKNRISYSEYLECERKLVEIGDKDAIERASKRIGGSYMSTS